MVLRHSLTALGLALASCASPPVPAPPPPTDGGAVDTGAPSPDTATPSLMRFDARSGRRLQAVWYQGSDGAAIHQGWFDTGLGERCAFDRAIDGTLRCLPILAFDASLVSCPDGRCVTTFATRTYGRRFEPGACPARWRMFRRGTPVEVPGQPGARLVSEVAPAEFVAATLQPDGGDRLAPLWLVAEDGARALHAWRDAKQGFDCDFRDLESNGRAPFSPELRCMPAWHGYRSSGIGPFSDAGCQEPLAWVSDACPPSFVWGDRGACSGAPVALYRLGKPRVRGYGRNPFTCEETSLSADGRYFEVEAEVRPGELGEALTHLRGAGRIQTIVIETAAGEARWGLWDSELGAVCNPGPLEGPTICLPQVDLRQLGLLLYADSACTQPLAEESTACATPRLFGDAAFPDRIRKVGPRYEGPVFEVDAKLQICRSSTRVELGSVGLHRLGPILDRSSFAPLLELRR